MLMLHPTLHGTAPIPAGETTGSISCWTTQWLWGGDLGAARCVTAMHRPLVILPSFEPLSGLMLMVLIRHLARHNSHVVPAGGHNHRAHIGLPARISMKYCAELQADTAQLRRALSSGGEAQRPENPKYICWCNF